MMGGGHWSANKGRKQYVSCPKEKCVKCFLWEGGGGSGNAQQSKMCQLMWGRGENVNCPKASNVSVDEGKIYVHTS
jgi:hypothetical protein